MPCHWLVFWEWLNHPPAAVDLEASIPYIYIHIYIHLFISRVLQQQTWLWQCSIYMHLWFSFLLKTRKSHGNVGSWVIGIRFPAWRDFNAFRSNSHPERFLKMRLVVLWMRSFGLESDGGNGRVSQGHVTGCLEGHMEWWHETRPASCGSQHLDFWISMWVARSWGHPLLLVAHVSISQHARIF